MLIPVKQNILLNIKDIINITIHGELIEIETKILTYEIMFQTNEDAKIYFNLCMDKDFAKLNIFRIGE